MITITYNKGHSPLLFIDRLVVKLDFLPGQSAFEVNSELWPLFDDPECFIGTKPASGHEISRNIVLESVANEKHYPHFIYRYADKQAQWIRLTLHPRDMKLKGFEDLHLILGTFVEGGWGKFVSTAKVTQIEASIDLEGIPFNSVHVLPDQAKTVSIYRSGQKTETVYLSKSKSNQTVIYDRAAKRKQQGNESKSGDCTRIERKKSGVNLKLHELEKLPNPFTHVKFVNVPANPPPSEAKPYQWALFTDAVAQRGLDPALKLLPQAKRTAYRKYIADNKRPWWMPELIWSGWPNVLAELKLTDATAWK